MFQLICNFSANFAPIERELLADIFDLVWIHREGLFKESFKCNKFFMKKPFFQHRKDSQFKHL